jgi:hypothetical protein
MDRRRDALVKLACLALLAALTGTAHAAICPAPPPCPPPENTCDNPDTTTFSYSTTSCFGDTASETVTTDTVDGGATGVAICIGPEKSVGFFVCPGTSNVNTNIETVTAVGTIFEDSFEQQPP